MNNIMTWARIMSLDVVVGSVASASLAAYWLEVEMPTVFWWILPLSVWVIYTADHLLDAHRLKDSAHTVRHLYHHRYFKEIGIGVGIAAFICICLVPVIIDGKLLLFGIAMGGFTLIHFLLVKWVGDRISWFFLKELGVGIIYAMGVWGAPFIYKQKPLVEVDVILSIQFFLLAMINLLGFSMYELDTDEQDGHSSFARAIGKRKTQKAILLLSFVVVFLGIWAISLMSSFLLFKVEVIYLFMLLVLVWVVFDEARFGKNESYRAWADAVFLFPILILC